jgi:hypothetical protein
MGKLKNKLKIKPHLQGTIDNLCGILCIINATRLVIHPARMKPHLFNKCVNALIQHKGSGDFIGRGTEPEDLEHLLKNIICKDYLLTYSKPFDKRSNVFLGEYWQAVNKFINESNRAVMILFETSSFSHFTVISKCDSEKLYLFDSAHTRYLMRKKCTTRKLSKKRTRLITPETTFFLQPRND